jgi:hypothetical protein
MSTKFSLRELFKSRKSKKAGKPEVQNGRHPPDGLTTPPIVSETPACHPETSITPELSRPQNPSVAASVDGEDRVKAASSSVTESQAPSNLPVADAQETPASLDAGAEKPPSALQETSKASSTMLHMLKFRLQSYLLLIPRQDLLGGIRGPKSLTSRSRRPLRHRHRKLCPAMLGRHRLHLQPQTEPLPRNSGMTLMIALKQKRTNSSRLM